MVSCTGDTHEGRRRAVGTRISELARRQLWPDDANACGARHRRSGTPTIAASSSRILEVYVGGCGADDPVLAGVDVQRAYRTAAHCLRPDVRRRRWSCRLASSPHRAVTRSADSSGRPSNSVAPVRVSMTIGAALEESELRTRAVARQPVHSRHWRRANHRQRPHVGGGDLDDRLCRRGRDQGDRARTREHRNSGSRCAHWLLE